MKHDRRFGGTWTSAGSPLVAALVASFALTVSCPATEGTVLRTLVYHQLTAYTNTGVAAAPRSAVISANGQKIAFARCIPGTPYTNEFYAINFDGTGLTLLDVWPSTWGFPKVDISADGSTVLLFDGQFARLVNSDGSNLRTVIELTSGWTTAFNFRMSADGQKIFLHADRAWNAYPYPSHEYEGGLWWMDTDGSNRTEIVGLGQLEARYQVPAGYVRLDSYSFFAVSGSGSRLLFQAGDLTTSQWRLWRVNADGSGLEPYPLAPPVGSAFYDFGVSGDGRKVFYRMPMVSGDDEVGVMNLDGAGRVLLPACGSWTVHGGWLTHDGSELLTRQHLLFDADGVAGLELAWPDVRLLKWVMPFSTMNSNATRFAFCPPMPSESIYQLATLELNPTNRGLAPLISEASANPPYVITNTVSTTLLSCRVTPTNSLWSEGVNVGVFTNGFDDPNVYNGGWLQDLGTDGDVAAGDGIYSRGGWGVLTDLIGPRTLRFEVEMVDDETKSHVTAIDIAPFFVVGEVPTNPPPVMASISPSNAPPGARVTITGSGFDGNPTNNYVLFGNAPAYVAEADPGGTALTVIVPALPPGAVTVTVTTLGQTSAGTPFTVTAVSQLRLSIRRVNGLAGLDIYGTVGRTCRVEWVRDLGHTNQWSELTRFLLPVSPFFWTDALSAGEPYRFYRGVEQE